MRNAERIIKIIMNDEYFMFSSDIVTECLKYRHHIFTDKLNDYVKRWHKLNVEDILEREYLYPVNHSAGFIKNLLSKFKDQLKEPI